MFSTTIYTYSQCSAAVAAVAADTVRDRTAPLNPSDGDSLSTLRINSKARQIVHETQVTRVSIPGVVYSQINMVDIGLAVAEEYMSVVEATGDADTL